VEEKVMGKTREIEKWSRKKQREVALLI